jgi:hypothetical protein
MKHANPRLVGYTMPRSNRFLIRIVLATVLMTLAILAVLPFTQALSGDPRDRTLRSVDVANLPPPEPPPPEPPPPEEEEEEPPPPPDEVPPMLDISMLESVLNPGTGGVAMAGLNLGAITAVTSLQEAIIFSISELDRPPRLLRGGQLNYPIDVQKEGMKGRVRVQVRIGPTGSASVIEVFDSPDLRITQFLRAEIPKWVYESPLKDGEAVTAEYIQPVEFDFSQR